MRFFTIKAGHWLLTWLFPRVSLIITIPGSLAVFKQSYLFSWLISRFNSMNHTYNSVMESGQLPLLSTNLRRAPHLLSSSPQNKSLPVRNCLLSEHFTVVYICSPTKPLRHVQPAVNTINSTLSRTQAHRGKLNNNKKAIKHTPKHNCTATTLLTNWIVAVYQFGGCVLRHYGSA